MKSRLTYATLLEIEFILALATSYLMGAQKWALCFICLALTLLLGVGTTLMYWKLIDKANQTSTGSDRTRKRAKGTKINYRWLQM